MEKKKERQIKEEETRLHILKLQEKLRRSEKKRMETEAMIMASDCEFRSVYCVDLIKDKAICYKCDPCSCSEGHYKKGESFSFFSAMNRYGTNYISEEFRRAFSEFTNPKKIKQGLSDQNDLECRYLVHRNDIDQYESMRIIRVYDKLKEGSDIVFIAFKNIDKETQEASIQKQNYLNVIREVDKTIQEKRSFQSNVSHELRTPMNAILGISEIALKDPECSQNIKDYLNVIHDSADHLMSLINKMLDASDAAAGNVALNKEVFSMLDLIEEIDKVFSAKCLEKKIKFTDSALKDAKGFYIGDKKKLNKILFGIMENAVKFTPVEGRVFFGIETKEESENKESLCFTIRDNGIGIAEEFQEKIYDAFSKEDTSPTSEFEGLGLGLLIAKDYVEMMSGDIEVQSKKNEGSCFKVTVRLEKAEMIDSKRPGIEKKTSLHGKRVLLAEDIAINAQIVDMLLSSKDIKTDHCENGRIALEQFMKHPAGYYDAILMDMRMPEMDGLEATKRIRALKREDAKKIPIIALTANAFDEDVQKSLQAGLNAHLSKPVEPARLFETLESLIDETV